MANYYAQVSLASISGETADVNVNIFSFVGPDVFTPTEGGHVRDCVDAFYNLCWSAGALRGRAFSGHTVKIYPAVTTTPNYPIWQGGITLPPAGAAMELPLEVNLCVSYACDSATIVPRARRRGRIYIAGWTEASNDTGRPVETAYTNLAAAYHDYCEDLNAETGFVASIWSRSNSSLYPIERVWADNEWDTMRSRGGKATLRSTQTV